MAGIRDIAKQMMTPGKGLLAADWGAKSVGKRLEQIGLENTPENRQKYRQILFSAPGLGEYISGVIENEETVMQTTGDGTALLDLLIKQGIIPGVKVDRGLVDMAKFPGEKIAQGMDDLRARLTEYKLRGVKFGKFRSVVTIGEGIPTLVNLTANSHVLAQYAAICHELELVPIVEPEVLMDGSHSLEKCVQVTEMTHRILFQTLADYKINLEGLILKTNMAIAGKDSGEKPGSEEIGRATVEMLQRSVPAEVAGVVFLSGGQEAGEATRNLNAICKAEGLPWPLTFSFERALEEPTLSAWKGQDDKIQEAQKILVHRAKMNALAVGGEYTEEKEAEEVENG